MKMRYRERAAIVSHCVLVLSVPSWPPALCPADPLLNTTTIRCTRWLDLQVHGSRLFDLTAQTIGQQLLSRDPSMGLVLGRASEPEVERVMSRLTWRYPLYPCGASVSFVG